MRRVAAAALLAYAGLAFAAKPFPPSPGTYVYNEGVISKGAESALSARLAAFERQTGHQFVAALFQSLDGESLEDYVNKLFRAWSVGDKKRNDGVVFALFKQDRRWRVEVGYGLEATLTDLEAAELARTYAVPAFKQGKYDQGVLAATDAIIAKASGAALPRAPQASQGGAGVGLALFVIFLMLLIMFLRNVALVDSTTIATRRRCGGWTGGWGGGGGFGGGDWGGGFGGGGGGFSGGGGSSGGGGASGGW